MPLTFPYDVLVPWCKLEAHAAQSDQERLADLQAKSIPQLAPGTMVNARTVASAFANPLDGERLNRKLDAIGAWEAPAGDDDLSVLVGLVVRTCKRWMEPTQGGIDVGHAGVRALLDQLPNITGTGVTASEVATLKALGEARISQLESWGASICLGVLACARQLIAEGN